MYLNRCGISTPAAQAIKLFLVNPLFGPPPRYVSCNRLEYRGSGEGRGCLGVLSSSSVDLHRRDAARYSFAGRDRAELQMSSIVESHPIVGLYYFVFACE